jgi:hypothetical protein
LLILSLALAWVVSCGRTGLDDLGAGQANGSGGSAVTGAGGSGGRGATGGAGGSTGSGGRAGTGGGGVGGAAGIPCGAATCAAGTSCCLQAGTGGMGSATCIGPQQTCTGGVSLACVDTPSCGGRGRVCCLNLQTFSTACATTAACVVQPGLILCSSDSDCNVLVPRCCSFRGTGVCAAQACNLGTGGGTGTGSGGGRGGGRGSGN